MHTDELAAAGAGGGGGAVPGGGRGGGPAAAQAARRAQEGRADQLHLRRPPTRHTAPHRRRSHAMALQSSAGLDAGDALFCEYLRCAVSSTG